MRHFLSKIIKYTLYLTLLIPLLVTPFTFFSWHFGKTIIFQALVEIISLLFLIEVIGKWRRGVTVNLRRLNGLDFAILGFLLVLLLTAIPGVNFINSFWGNQARVSGLFTWLHFGVWYFLLINAFDETDWRMAFKIVSVAAAVVSLTVFFENRLPLTWQSSSGGGILGNRAFASSYLLIAVGLSLAAAIKTSNKWRYLFLGLGVLDLFALFTLGTRGALVGLVSGVLTGLIALSLFPSEKKVKRLSLGIILLLVVSVAGLVFLARRESFAARFPRLAYYTNIAQFTTGTGETRLLAWQIAWQGFKERPFFGWGINNYEIIFNKYYNPQFLKHSFAETEWDKPHNWFLEIIDSAGILGGLGYLVIWVFLGFYLSKKDSTLPPIRRVVLAGTLAASIAQSLFFFENTNSLLLVFMILALVSAAESPSSAASASSRKVKLASALLVFYSLLVIFSLFEFNYLPLRASYYLQLAQMAETSRAWGYMAEKTLAVPVSFRGENAIFLAERFLQIDKAQIPHLTDAVPAALETAQVLEAEAARYPDNPLFPVWAGRIYMVLGEQINERYYANADKFLKSAQAISPNKQEYLFLLGRLYLLKKEFPQAIEFQKRAVAAAPDIGTSHWFLGLSYVASGDATRGLAEIEDAIKKGFSLTRNQTLYIIDLYAEVKRYDKVIEWYKALHEAEPEKIDWYVKLATAYALNGQKAEALQTVKEAVAQYPPLEADAAKFIKQYKLE